MFDLDNNNIWDEEASKIVIGGEDDIMTILDKIPLESFDDGNLLEDQWFTTGPHCFGPIPSNVLFFEPLEARKKGPKPSFSSPVYTPPPERCLTIDETPEEKTQVCKTTCNNPRNGVAAPKASRSKRAKPSGPTKWHFLSGIDSTFKKINKKRVSNSSITTTSAATTTTTKSCTHCSVTKTPQWREGPDGPKTLCNACGVRYRTGRLFPEYRPAASPTFRLSLHSNSHKKVVEMRRKDKGRL